MSPHQICDLLNIVKNSLKIVRHFTGQLIRLVKLIFQTQAGVAVSYPFVLC